MTESAHKPWRRLEWLALILIGALFIALSLVGITWGLPTRDIDRFLFGDGEPWSGEKIYRLAKAGEKFSPTRGADVDVDPLARDTDEPINLTETDEQVAAIYLRYRLYTYQPDEMITMMALAGMRPGAFDFDPRLYQYGGLFIYPVGALIKACGVLGLIDVRSDIVYYLDNPDEFGKFYIVARAYAAAWGLLGMLIVYAIARRLAGPRGAWLAALLFTLMPVVVCMAHEGKPHLPGAVLMLAAVWLAMRHLDARKRGENAKSGWRANANWYACCVCCGAAQGMVLSSPPVFLLIPLVAWMERRGVGGTRNASSEAEGQPLPHGRGTEHVGGDLPSGEAVEGGSVYAEKRQPLPHGRGTDQGGGAVSRFLKRSIAGVAVAILVYLVTNPYVPINAVVNREVLRSNFGNSLAMYEIDRIGEGFLRVVELTVEGATLPVALFGVLALGVALWRRKARPAVPLIVVAAVFFVQFVLIGAGKPAEYGRFGVFTNTALAIGAACTLSVRWRKVRAIVNWTPAGVVVVWCAAIGGAYTSNFRLDSIEEGSRRTIARFCSSAEKFAEFEDLLAENPSPKLVYVAFREPAPFCYPPINFGKYDFLLVANWRQFTRLEIALNRILYDPVDSTELENNASGRPMRAVAMGKAPTINVSGIDIDRPLSPISWANKPFVVGLPHRGRPDGSD